MHSTTSLFVGVIIQNFNDLKAEKDKCVDKQMVNRLCMDSQEEEEGRGCFFFFCIDGDGLRFVFGKRANCSSGQVFLFM